MLVFISLLRRHPQESGELVVNSVCRDRPKSLWQFSVRSRPAHRPCRTAVRGCRLIDTAKWTNRVYFVPQSKWPFSRSLRASEQWIQETEIDRMENCGKKDD